MSDLDINALVLAWMTTYGSPMIAALLFLGALGIPLPSTLIVIAAGAFVRQSYLNLYSTPMLGLFGVVVGDILVYGVGRFARIWIDKRYGESPNWIKSQEYFTRRGGIAIYLTRWLLTILALPVSLVAGSSDYPFPKFVLFVAAGELTWIMLYGGLGYMFGSQWELISEFISQFAVVILGVLVVAIGVYLLVRFWRRSRQESAAS